MTRRFKRLVDSPLRPPAIATTEALPFATADRDRLRHWLDDQRWPQGTMGLSMLEGYLTALIVWPIGVTSGAWLPRIWGDYGWRAPPVIDDVSSFDDFVSLITAYLQRLDRDLTAEPSTFTPTLWNIGVG